MTETPGGDPAKMLLAEILAIVNRHQGRNAEQAMIEIQAACMASIDRAAPTSPAQYADYDAQSRAEVITLISRQAKRIAALTPPSTYGFEDAAEELREGTPHHAVPGSAADWRNAVADWLEHIASACD